MIKKGPTTRKYIRTAQGSWIMAPGKLEHEKISPS